VVREVLYKSIVRWWGEKRPFRGAALANRGNDKSVSKSRFYAIRHLILGPDINTKY
jgi:hypothetical protein